MRDRPLRGHHDGSENVASGHSATTTIEARMLNRITPWPPPYIYIYTKKNKTNIHTRLWVLRALVRPPRRFACVACIYIYIYVCTSLSLHSGSGSFGCWSAHPVVLPASHVYMYIYIYMCMVFQIVFSSRFPPRRLEYSGLGTEPHADRGPYLQRN